MVEQLSDQVLIAPEVLLKSSLTYLLFDDTTDWVRLGEKFSNNPSEDDVPLGFYMDTWWMDNAEAMNDIFADLVAVRPFRWVSVVVKDDFAKITVFPIEDQ